MATPRKEKPAETPGYWPTTKMAELFELTARRIQQLTQDGVLKTHDTPAGRRYNVGEATKDYIRFGSRPGRKARRWRTSRRSTRRCRRARNKSSRHS